MIIPKNPFNPAQPASSHVFVGRSDLQRQLATGLKDGLSFGLTGGPGLGKTSLLSAVKRDLESVQSTSFTGALLVPIYLDCQGDQYQKVGDVLQAFVSELVAEFRRQYQIVFPRVILSKAQVEAQHGRLEAAMGQMLDWSFKRQRCTHMPILLLDDFHRIGRQHWLQELPSIFQTSVNRRSIAMVLTGKRALADELRDDVSPLRLLITQQYELQSFSHHETQELVDVAYSHGWQVEDGCTKVAYEITKGHPYRLHYYFYNALSKEGKLSVAYLKMLSTDRTSTQHLEKILHDTSDLRTLNQRVDNSSMPQQPNETLVTVEGELRSEITAVTSQTTSTPRRASHTDENLKGQIDFAIISVREDEYAAVLERFPDGFFYHGQHRPYIIHRVPLDSGQSYAVATVRCPEQGGATGQQVAHDIIADLAPNWLMLVGIAGGVPANEFTLGDVVAAMRLQDFSVQARYEGGATQYAIGGGPMHRQVQDYLALLPAMSHNLGEWNRPNAIGKVQPPVSLDGSNFYGDANWQLSVRQSLERHFGDGSRQHLPRVTTGAIAASDALMKDATLLDQWKESARQLIAVEMELAGVYTASRTRDREYPIAAVRGISDIVGFKRHPDWTEYACQTAASFARSLVESQPFEPVTKISNRLR